MKDKLIPLALNELLDFAPSFRRERTTPAFGLASSFNISRHEQSQIIQLCEAFNSASGERPRQQIQASRHRRKSLTPELTGRSKKHSIYASTNVDEKHSICAPVE